MHLPDFLESYRDQAVKLLPKIGHIEFSGETYQVQVLDPALNEDIWAFVQLESNGFFKDGFCSCEGSEDVSRCPHLAAAYLRIYNETPYPLHQRFDKSLWNKLCYLLSDELGYETSLLEKKEEAQYQIGSRFAIKGKTPEGKKQLQEIITHKRDETEETSLKFSNLSQEEIKRWREGRPSAQLQYELSFWNDFAKWLMLLQDAGAPYRISFEDGKDRLPEIIQVDFSDVIMRCKLNREELIDIIPSLATVDSPLSVHDMEENTIESIRYDQKNHALEVKSDHRESSKKGIDLGEWVFATGEGFFAQKAHGLLMHGELKGDRLAEVLDQYHELIAGKLEGITLHSGPLPVHYMIRFDDDWDLHIESYLFQPGDLKEATVYGDWVYREDFYRTEGFRFDAIEVTIHKGDVGDFVTRHRAWLNHFSGYESHLASLEGQLSYAVSDEDHLSFSGDFPEADTATRSHDFGAWIWVEGQGFYSKISTVSGMPLRPGIALDKEQVAPFIRMNREELKYVSKFFSEHCPVKEAGLIVKLTDDERIWVQPHYELEEDYRDKNVRFFENFTYVADEGFYQLPAGKQVPAPFQEADCLSDDEIPPFVSQEIPRLRENYNLIVDPRLHVPEELALSIGGVVQRDRGWYGLKLSYKTENGFISISDMWTAMHEKKRFLYHEAGLLDLHHPRYDWIRKIAKKNIDRRSNLTTLTTMEVVKLNIFDPMQVDAQKRSDADEALEFLEGLTKFEVPQPPDLTGLASDLRPYQEVGLDWLWFLYNQNLSGLLCDDMGLGKTHQAMALMAAIRNEKGKEHGPFIVICPTSVIYHWEDKLQEHLPGFKVCTFYGSRRSIPTDYDILLTSYGVWRIESKQLQQIPFEVAFLDEVQMAKNANSRLHGSLLRLDAQMRIGLTGTPIENYLQELKALFDIVLPDYMPGPTEFKEHFIKPIDREKDQDRKKLLNRFINPFLLRRKKEEVLTDLPAKTEEVYHCGLMPEQENLYRDVLESSRRQILQELSDNKQPIPYIHIFAILSSLKQICDHPAVYLKRPEFFKEHRSGKWDLFVELLHEARDSQQKVVVYSQYLGMLDIIEEYLNESGIGYASIRGATTNRGDQLKKFNSDPNCEVFVGSLQASGLGVDLTAASVVIHYDRWWNAARENQATDRVHRIGQQRGVQVFKLVTKGTFEERIDELISSKGQLMEEVVGSDDQHIVKYLDRDEILELLKFTGNR